MANKINLDVSERLDITCRQGDSFSLTLNLKDSAGAVITLVTSNYKFFMQVKDKEGNIIIGSTEFGDSADLNFAVPSPLDTGDVTISATPATMRQISAGRYIYDLQYLIDGVDGTNTTILRGFFTVNGDISKI